MFDFSTTVNNRLKILAESRGDELIGNPTGSYPAGRACDYRLIKLKCGHEQDIRISHYEKEAYSCKQCFEDDLHAVAESQGLSLVSMDIVRHGSERLYVRACGHTEMFSNAYLRKHKINNCQVCLFENVMKNLDKHGFSINSKIQNGFNIKCNVCGNNFDTQVNTCTHGKPVCKVCFETTLKNEAISSGFTYLPELEPARSRGEVRESINRWYSCNTCGHIDNYAHGSMRVGHARCDKCYSTRLISDATKQGIQYIGFHGSGLHKYILSCGCEKLINPYQVKRGIWACQKHSNTHFNRNNGVYLVKLEYGNFAWLKFGLAKDMGVRIKGYGLNTGTKTEILFYYPLPSRYDAMDIEKEIHKELSEHKLDKNFMKSFMKKGGHTECYPTSAEDKISTMVEYLYSEFEKRSQCP